MLAIVLMGPQLSAPESQTGAFIVCVGSPKRLCRSVFAEGENAVIDYQHAINILDM